MKFFLVPFTLLLALVNFLLSFVVANRRTSPTNDNIVPTKKMVRQMYRGGMLLQARTYATRSHNTGPPPDPNRYSRATFLAPLPASDADSALCVDASGYSPPMPMPVMMRAAMRALALHADMLSSAPKKVIAEHAIRQTRRPTKSDSEPKVTMPTMAPAYMADLMNSFCSSVGFIFTAKSSKKLVASSMYLSVSRPIPVAIANTQVATMGTARRARRSTQIAKNA
mmetsp:Transcript_96557/g.306326  ORF Transcript_96557/g.306326 Transcript_96557/m.306326 type:complete len:225 (+) Transcript_96557:907-1581(+)